MLVPISACEMRAPEVIMAIQTHKKSVGGFDFELTELPAFEGLEAFHRFLAMVGPAFPALAKAFRTAKDKRSDVDPAAVKTELTSELLVSLSDALPAILMRTKPEELSELTKVILGPCLVLSKVGKKPQLAKFLDVADELLRGRLDVLLQLIVWGAQVQFRSFFSLLGSGGLPEEGEASPSNSPTS